MLPLELDASPAVGELLGDDDGDATTVAEGVVDSVTLVLVLMLGRELSLGNAVVVRVGPWLGPEDRVGSGVRLDVTLGVGRG